MNAKHHLAQILAHGRALAASAFQPEAARSPLDVFLTADALAINQARQEHLAALGLDLSAKQVLEVGAGIGLHTPFFLERGCEVTVTDGNRANVEQIRRRHPALRAAQVDMDLDGDLRHLGSFDVVYCYGLLYHLADPEGAIRRLAAVCTGVLLLETCVSLGGYSEVIYLRDFAGSNQATSGIGCRPTRAWVMERLRQYFGHAFHSKTQPAHSDFPTDWDFPETRLLYRAVFVGSRQPLQAPGLTTEIPRKQARHPGAA
jgi:2-polyprenyl-3-methyl-5-hydroxy-6-metoxy-1,4-benzoquinol methylase